jgi:hypothetical protein
MLKPIFAACALCLAWPSFAQKTPQALPAHTLQAVPLKRSAAISSDAAFAVEPTFFKLFNLEAGLALCPSGDGNIYAAGAYEGNLALLKLNPAGNILYQRIFDIAVGEPDQVNEIMVDSDGNIAGCGVLSNAGYGQGFVFRLDPVDGTFFWLKILAGEFRTVHGLLEKSPGADFILYSDLAGGSNSPELMQIDRQTGAVVPAFAYHYHFNGSDEFAAMIAHQGALYAVGQSGAGTLPGKRRHALARIDGVSGAAQWAHLTPVALSGTAALYGRATGVAGASVQRPVPAGTGSCRCGKAGGTVRFAA